MAQNKYLIKYLTNELKRRDIKIVKNKIKVDDILEKIFNIKTVKKYKQDKFDKIGNNEYISLDVCIELMKESTKREVKNIITKIQNYADKEKNVLDVIKKYLKKTKKDYKERAQYGKYNIDIYIYRTDVVININEYDNKENGEDEKVRQEYLIKKFELNGRFDGTFIKVNLNDPNFCIINVLIEIRDGEIFSWMKQYNFLLNRYTVDTREKIFEIHDLNVKIKELEDKIQQLENHNDNTTQLGIPCAG
jgi:hypothetical protein